MAVGLSLKHGIPQEAQYTQHFRFWQIKWLDYSEQTAVYILFL